MLSERPWNLERLVHVIMGILFCAAFFILMQGALQHYLGKDKFAEGSFWYIFFGSLCIHGSILITTSIYLAWQHFGWAETFGPPTRSAPRAILLGLLAAIIFLPIGMMLQNLSLHLLTLFHLPELPQPALVQFDKSDSWITTAYLIFFATVFAPIAEEVLFRGIIYAGVKQLGFPRLALWGSAVFFGLIHANAPIFLPLVVFGLVLAWLYDKADNLLASITAHSAFNSINLIWMFYGDQLFHVYQRFFSHGR